MKSRTRKVLEKLKYYRANGFKPTEAQLDEMIQLLEEDLTEKAWNGHGKCYSDG